MKKSPKSPATKPENPKRLFKPSAQKETNSGDAGDAPATKPAKRKAASGSSDAEAPAATDADDTVATTKKARSAEPVAAE